MASQAGCVLRPLIPACDACRRQRAETVQVPSVRLRSEADGIAEALGGLVQQLRSWPGSFLVPVITCDTGVTVRERLMKRMHQQGDQEADGAAYNEARDTNADRVPADLLRRLAYLGAH